VPASTALYLTQSRSAWLALGVAVTVFLVLARPRPDVFRLLGPAVPSAAAVVTAALLGLATTRHESTREWRSLVLATVVVLGAGLAFVARSWPRGRRSDGLRIARLAGPAVAVAAATAATAGIVHGGLGDRAGYWRVAARAFAAHPLGGAGAGSWGDEWLRLRSIAVAAKDAHSLYLETLAELGLVGFVLLTAALAVPLVAARRRRTPFDAAVVASYSAYLVHTAFEWDWEMPVVTLSGLALAVALVVRSGESNGHSVRLAAPGRLAVAVGALAAAAFLAIGGLGHAYVVRAEKLAADGRLPEADAKAKAAERLLPWASEPLLVRGDLRLHSGDRADARRFYRRALQRDRSDWQIWLRLSLTTEGAAAVDARRRAFALDPGLARGTP
jgi:O-antigen ligase